MAQTAVHPRPSLETREHIQALVLHRLISSQVGRPLWDYRSDTELLQGLVDALDAHELLWKEQTISGDITAESILLAEDPDALGATGFLRDVEAVDTFSDAELLEPERTLSAANYESDLRPGSVTETATARTIATSRQGCVAVTESSQFMAIERLQAVVANRSLQRIAEHDIESFIWVLSYCVLRKLCNEAYAIQNDSAEYTFMKASLTRAFGKQSIEDILTSRKLAEPFWWCNDRVSGFMEPFFQEHISSPLRLLLQDLQAHSNARQRRPLSEHWAALRIRGAQAGLPVRSYRCGYEWYM